MYANAIMADAVFDTFNEGQINIQTQLDKLATEVREIASIMLHKKEE